MNNQVLMKRDFNKWKAGTDQFDPRYVFESAWLIQQAKINKLTEALNKYGLHKKSCNCLNTSGDLKCDCGFREAISSVEE